VIASGERMVASKARGRPLRSDKPRMCQTHATMGKAIVEPLNFSPACRIDKPIRAGEPCSEHDRSQDLLTAQRSYCRRRDKVT
jgi:hypothetical protein